MDTTKPTGLVWKVATIKDRGVAHAFDRYSITGQILDAGREPQRFSWTVSDLSNPTYDLTGAVRVS